MRITLKQLADLVGGTVHGNGERVIEGAAGLSEATEKDVSFLGNRKYTPLLKTSRAGAFLLPPDVPADGRDAVVLKNPPYGWAKVLELLEKERLVHPAGVHPTAVVAKSAKLGANVALGPYAVVEENAVVGDNTVLYAHVYIGRDVRVGRDCLFYPRVTVRERVTIGDRCVFQPGAVIGADGFGFTPHQGKHQKIPQVGTVEIGDDVEVQANATIDRGAVGPTKIGKGSKIDNLVQIAHNVEVGEHCLIAAMTGVAGSTKLERYVTLGAQVGVAGHLTVGEGVMAGGQTGIIGDIEPKSVIWGTPAHPLKDELKTVAAARKLPELMDELKKIKKKLGL